MKSSVAIIGSPDTSELCNVLKDALVSAGIECTLCPETEPRQVLKWAMELLPSECAICIFTDTDGRLTASITTALDPDVSALVWAPPPADPAKIATIISDTPALICFAGNPNIPAQTIAKLLLNLQTASGQSRIKPDSNNQTARIENVPTRSPDITQSDTPPLSDETDREAYQQLEAMMSARIKENIPRQEPVQIQKPGFDFSMPLRQLMSKGKSLARKKSHKEVLGVHYLEAMADPYLSALNNAGLKPEHIQDYLNGMDSGEDIAGDPVISDEVFNAVSYGKERARKCDQTCVRVVDFLSGLLKSENSSVSDLLEVADLSSAGLQEVLNQMDATSEACGESFFQPSSLDQDSFYQFDSSQVRNIESRLKDLPGFQKAAKRVAETREKKTSGQSKSAAPATIQPITLTAIEPPEKPELLKVAGEFPSVDVIEQIADQLLEGQLVAFPSDIMTAIAVDAANPAAVTRLRQAANLPDDKPLSILINSTSQLKHLVKADLDELESLFDALWPGPLTLIFKSAGATGRHIASNGNIAVRQPADNLSLAILSMLGRPLAVTSWENSLEKLTGHAGAIVTSTDTPASARTTVVDLTEDPWQVLREGAIPGQTVLSFYSE